MNRFDEKLKQLKNVDRDEKARERSLYAAREKLKDPAAKKSGFSVQKAGLFAAAAAVLFIGFLLSYEIIFPGDTETSTGILTNDSDIQEAFLDYDGGEGEFHMQERIQETAVHIEDEPLLDTIESILHQQGEETDAADYESELQLLLRLEDGDELPVQLSLENGATYVSVFGETEILRYGSELGEVLYLEREVRVQDRIIEEMSVLEQTDDEHYFNPSDDGTESRDITNEEWLERFQQILNSSGSVTDEQISTDMSVLVRADNHIIHHLDVDVREDRVLFQNNYRHTDTVYEFGEDMKELFDDIME